MSWLVCPPLLAQGPEDLDHLPEDLDPEVKAYLLESLALPERSVEEWEEMRNGLFVPGSALMGRSALEQLFSTTEERLIFETELPPVIEKEPEGEWPEELSVELLKTYFDQQSDGFLNDPQGLLTESGLRNQNGVLEQHAQRSVIDLYLYLFDAKQDIPSRESPHSVLRNFFSDQGDVAVVFYHHGRPERAQIAYSGRILRGISVDERKQALQAAMESAGEKSDAASQLESFLAELSKHVFHMEKDLPPEDITDAVLAEMEASREAAREKSLSEVLPEGVITVFASALLAGLIGLLVWLLRRFADARRVYLFPRAEGSPILDAPHAAGVGAVLSYASASQPPAVQKRQAQDYLQEL